MNEHFSVITGRKNINNNKKNKNLKVKYKLCTYVSKERLHVL